MPSIQQIHRTGKLRPGVSFRKAGSGADFQPFRRLVSSVAILASLAVTWTACHGKDKPGPKEVYRRWAKAVAANQCSKMYSLLDEKSRWAVISAAKDTARAAALIQKAYPPSRRGKELSKLGVSTATGSPKDYFVDICKRHRYPARLAKSTGALTEIRVQGSKAVVTTDKGTKIELLRDKYGRWGCNALHEELVRRQLIAANFFKMVESNASDFQKKTEARPSTGGS